jgi:hypothetical protein
MVWDSKTISGGFWIILEFGVPRLKKVPIRSLEASATFRSFGKVKYDVIPKFINFNFHEPSWIINLRQDQEQERFA